MPDNIWVAEPSSWESATLLARALAGRDMRWGFRGVSDATWELQPSLERISKNHGTYTNRILERERSLLNEFKRRAHHYLPNPPQIEDEMEWLRESGSAAWTRTKDHSINSRMLYQLSYRGTLWARRQGPCNGFDLLCQGIITPPAGAPPCDAEVPVLQGCWRCGTGRNR